MRFEFEKAFSIGLKSGPQPDAQLCARLCQPLFQFRQRDVGRLDKKSPDKIAMLLSAPRQPIATLRLGTSIAAQPAQRLPADRA